MSASYLLAMILCKKRKLLKSLKPVYLHHPTNPFQVNGYGTYMMHQTLADMAGKG